MQHPINGYGLAVVLFVCFTLAGLGLVMSNSQRHDTELKFCALVENSQGRTARQVKAYQEAPPTTEAGREQRQETIAALKNLDKLMKDLGCPIEKEEAGK
jgi:hypothetical protein